MKILLTGASGAIGTELRKQNPEIIPVKVRWNDMSALEANLPGADVLIHAGASLKAEYLSDLMLDNVFTTTKVLESVQKVNPNTRVLFLSSMSILGADGKIKPVEKMSDYSLSKYVSERICLQHPNVVSVRFATIFYRDPARDGLSKIIHTAKTTGKVSISPCCRNFITLDTAAAELLTLCTPENFDKNKPAVNIGDFWYKNLYAIGAHLEDKFNVQVSYNAHDSSEVFVNFGGVSVGCTNLFEEIDAYYASI